MSGVLGILMAISKEISHGKTGLGAIQKEFLTDHAISGISPKERCEARHTMAIYGPYNFYRRVYYMRLSLPIRINIITE